MMGDGKDTTIEIADMRNNDYVLFFRFPRLIDLELEDY